MNSGMRSFKPMVVLAVLMLLIGISLVINEPFAAKDRRYDELVRTYECHGSSCTADFNWNGSPDQLEIAENDSRGLSWWLILRDGPRELFRRPYVSMDGTLRTHFAMRTGTDGVRLLIFDGTDGEGKHVSKVYLWNGERMAETSPSSLDREILAAMAARDDTGGWTQWVTYRLTRDFYFLSLTIITAAVVLSYGIRSLIRK